MHVHDLYMHARRHLGWHRVHGMDFSFPCIVPCTIAGALVAHADTIALAATLRKIKLTLITTLPSLLLDTFCAR